MACYPALGSHVSLALSAGSQQLHFYATEPLEVWSNLSPAKEWHATPFLTTHGKLHVASFDLSFLQQQDTFEFTYRRADNDQIHWLGSGASNGTVTVAPPTKEVPADLWTGLPETALLESSTGSLSLKLFQFDLPTSLEAGAIHSISLGKPSSPGKALAFERVKPTWIDPLLLDTAFHLPSELDTLMLLSATSDASTVTAILPITTNSVTTTLRGSMDPAEGEIWLRCQRNASQEKPMAFCIVGHCKEWEVNRLLSEMVATARKHVFMVASKVSAPDVPSGKLTYCTWNSLGRSQTLSKLFAVLSSLADADVDECFDSVLLDDGWQDVNSTEQLETFGARDGWMDVEFTKADRVQQRPDSGYASLQHSRANSMEAGDVAPTIEALRRGVDLLKIRYPSIKRVGAWVTMQGYWRGLAPDSMLAERYAAKEVQAVNYKFQQDTWLLPSSDRFAAFWQDYFETLRGAGINFVKVDNQATMDSLSGPGAEDVKSEAYQRVVDLAAGIFGSQNVVFCMAHSPRIVTSEVGIAGQKQSLWKQYDDYLPDIEDSHGFLVAYTSRISLLSRPLALLPDFDMFQSRHAFAAYHAAHRVLSPAPMYLTDKIGEHDSSLYGQLCACDKVHGLRSAVQVSTKPIYLAGQTFSDTMGWGTGPASKLAAQIPQVGSAIIGAFNCRQGGSETLDAVTRRDVADALDGLQGVSSDLLLYSPSSKAAIILERFALQQELSTPSLASLPLLSLALPSKAFELVSVVPWQTVDMDSIAVQIGCVGLSDKLGGLAALQSAAPVTIAPQKATLLADASDAQDLEIAQPSGTLVERILSAAKAAASTLAYIFSFRWLFGFSNAEDADERTPLLQEDPAPSAPSKTGLRVQTTHAGKLSFVISKQDGGLEQVQKYDFTIDEQPVAGDNVSIQSLSDSLLLLSLDMDSAIRAFEQGVKSSEECFQVDLFLH